MRLAFAPLNNPLVQREIRSRMRSNRTLALLVGFVGLMAGGLAIVLQVSGVNSTAAYAPNPVELGYILFHVALSVELVLIGMVAAGTAAGAISGERERQTWDLLVVTGLPARDIVIGQLFASVMLVLWLVVAALPVFIPLLRVGVASWDVLLRVLLFFMVTALVYGALGLLCSAWCRRTVVAVIVSYLIGGGWAVYGLTARFWFMTFNRPAMSPGPFLVELLNPPLALLRSMGSHLELAYIPGGSAPAGVGAVLTRTLLSLLGHEAEYWIYILGSLFVALLFTSTTIGLIRRRSP